MLSLTSALLEPVNNRDPNRPRKLWLPDVAGEAGSPSPVKARPRAPSTFAFSARVTANFTSIFRSFIRFRCRPSTIYKECTLNYAPHRTAPHRSGRRNTLIPTHHYVLVPGKRRVVDGCQPEFVSHADIRAVLQQ